MNMKIMYFTIITAGCILVLTILCVTNYDPTPITKDNIFGITALVIHRPVFSCPFTDCHFPDYYLKINSKSKAFLLGYDICDGMFCAKRNDVVIPLPLMDVLHPDYLELPLPDNLFWRDGDTVNMRVKVSTSLANDTLTFDSTLARKTWIDLGKSEIVRSS
jgi:hypothetical protein